jgi:misacylated tRNA(Ala) deacylase
MHQTTLLYMPDIESNYITEFSAKVLRAGKDFVVLDRTAFYPLGGGQPSDIGTLSWGPETAKVAEVKKKGEIVHSLKGPVPAEGTVVRGAVDWALRYGHMRMHTAQHLISAVVYDMFGGKTVGNQIHADHSRIDFEPTNLTPEDLEKIKTVCNERVAKAVPVKLYEMERPELEKKKGQLRITLEHLPPSVRSLRIIEIEEYDVCPCAGTHIRNLVEIVGFDKMSRESKGKDRTRVEYSILPAKPEIKGRIVE